MLILIFEKNVTMLKRHGIILPLLTLILIIVFGRASIAQSQADSTFQAKTGADSTKVLYYKGTILNFKLDLFTPIDTSTLESHQYDWLFRKNSNYSTLSNIGLAHTNSLFSPMLQAGFSMSWPYFQHYLITNKQVKYYQLMKPYTELFYVMGPKKEQDFQLTFSRDLIQGLTFGMNFYLISSPGEYKRSGTNNNSGYLTLTYLTPNKRYHANVNYLFNKMQMQENGGISDDSYFTQNKESDRYVIPVNLTDAENTVKETGIFVEQYFNLSRPHQKPDTTNRLDLGSISYAFQYKKDSYLFTDRDPLAPFYDTLFAPLDSMQTYDSTGIRYIKNRIGWTSLGYGENIDQKPFYLYANLGHDNITQLLPIDTIPTVWNQMNVSGGIGISLKKSFYLKGSGYLYFGGYNSGDFGIKGTINQFLGNKSRNIGELNLGIELVSKTPWWFYQHFNSNHFRWDNSFNKETYLILHGDYHFKNMQAGVDFTTLGNYTYLNDSLMPTQISSAATVLKIYVLGNLSAGKFGFDTKLTYQATSNPSEIRLPTFSGTMNLFFKSLVFKKAATLQTGVQLRYFTAYRANAYMPELRAFYLQNDVQTGNYLWADVYVTLKVKRARLFIKMRNVTGYFEGYNYWLAPHYPDRDAGFYFGVSWRFHD